MTNARNARTSRWESVSAVASALLVLGVIGYLLYGALAVPRTPPDVAVRMDSIARGSAGYLLHFSALNGGSETAAAVRVRGELWEGAASTEVAEAVLDYVPGKGSRRGLLVFTRDPRALRLTLRAAGYTAP